MLLKRAFTWQARMVPKDENTENRFYSVTCSGKFLTKMLACSLSCFQLKVLVVRTMRSNFFSFMLLQSNTFAASPTKKSVRYAYRKWSCAARSLTGIVGLKPNDTRRVAALNVGDLAGCELDSELFQDCLKFGIFKFLWQVCEGDKKLSVTLFLLNTLLGLSVIISGLLRRLHFFI